MSQGTSTDAGFRPQLGLFDATMLVAGSMIGSGIFIVSADIARDVGSAGWLLLIWVLTGVMTIAGALSFAELAAMMPHAGGTYVFLREAYGPLWGFLFGWTNLLIIQTGFIAAVSVAFAKFLGVLVPELGTNYFLFRHEFASPIVVSLPVPWMDRPMEFFRRDIFTISSGQLVAVGVAVFLTLLNCAGVREGKWVQNLFTVAKTAGLVLLIVVGLWFASSRAAIEGNLQDPFGAITQTNQFLNTLEIVPHTAATIVLVLCGAMVGSLFSSDAWGNVTFAAAEVHEPRRNLPLALLFGTGIVSVLYVLANLAYLSALPVRGTPALDDKVTGYDRLSNRPDLIRADTDEDRERAQQHYKMEKERFLREATTKERGIAWARDDRVGTAVLELVSPQFGVAVMAIAIMISTFGCVNGIILSNSRLCYAMARDGLFFRSVGHLSPRGVPVNGLIVQLIWSIVLIFSGSYNELLDYVIFAALLFYVLTISALFVLRRKRPDWQRPYRAVGYPIVPAVYIVLCAIIMVGLLIVKPIYSWPSFIIILSGIPVYFLWRGPGNQTASTNP